MNSSAIQASSPTASQAEAALDLRVDQVGVLGRRVVAPDGHVLDLGDRGAGLVRELGDRAVVVEADHRGEPLARDVGRVRHRDQAVRVGRVADDQDLDVVRRAGVDRLALRLEDAPFASSRSARSMPLPRGRAPTSRPSWQPSKAGFGSSWISIPVSSGKAQSSSSIAVPSAALTASGISSSVRCDLGVGAEHLAGRDPEQERVADLAGGAGDGDVDGDSLAHVHLLACRFSSIEARNSCGGLELLIAADQQREVLGHLSALDRLDADPLERLGELGDLGRLVHPTAGGERAGPGEDRGDRIGRGRLALLVLAVVAGDGAVGGLGLDGLAVGGHQDAGHQPERAEALGDGVGLDVAVVVLAGPDVAALPLQRRRDHVVDQAVLVGEARRLEVGLELARRRPPGRCP